MIYTVNSTNIQNFAGLMYDYFRLRHEIFVHKMKWEALRSPLSLEVDEFDTRNTTYLVAVDDGQILGSVRLLSTEYKTLFTSTFADRVSIDIPCDSQVLELSRFFCHGGLQSQFKNGTPAMPAIMLAAYDYGLENGIKEFVAILEQPMAVAFTTMDFGAKQVGNPFDYAPGRASVPLLCKVTPEIRDAVAKLFNISDRLLTDRVPERGFGSMVDLEVLSTLNDFAKTSPIGRQVYIRRVLEDIESGADVGPSVDDLMKEALLYSRNCHDRPSAQFAVSS